MTVPTPAPFAAPRTRRLQRLVAGLWLAVFAFASGGVPIVDALVGHGASVAAHWEDSGDRSCPPQHDASVCQLCQVHAAGRKSEGATLAPPIEIRFATMRPEEGELLRKVVENEGATRPRGPPLS